METNIDAQRQMTNGEAMMPEMMNIGVLLNKSWLSLKRNFGSLILLFLLNIGALFMMIMGVGLTVIFGGVVSLSQFGSINASNWESYISQLQPMHFVIPVILLLLLLIVYAVISTSIGYGQILLLADENKQSLSVYIRKGLGLILPALAVELLTFVLVFGNFFLLVVPAIIVGTLLSLTSFEVILSNKRGMEALKGSATIISQHFGYLFSRVLVLVAIQIVLQLISSLLRQGGDSFAVILTVYSLATSMVVNWFFVAYLIELYKEVKEKTDWNRPSSMTWMWITGLLGWILTFVIGFYAFKLLPRLNEPINQIRLPQLEQNLPQPVQEN